MLTISPDDVQFIDGGLARPECVLTTRRGDLFVSDARGGISVIDADRRQRLIKPAAAPDGFLPNGIALMPNRDVLIRESWFARKGVAADARGEAQF